MKKPGDAIRLDLPALVFLSVVFAAVLFSQAWKIVGGYWETNRKDPVELDMAKEWEEGATAHEIISRRPSPPGTDDGASWTIMVPCSIDRGSLVATMKNVLLQMYQSRQDHRCHHITVHLDSFGPSFCSRVAEGLLCKDGRVIDRVQTKPWDFHIRLKRAVEWADFGLRDADDVEETCRALSKARVCPWNDPFDEEEAEKSIQRELGVSEKEAKILLERGKFLVSANDTYTQDLR